MARAAWDLWTQRICKNGVILLQISPVIISFLSIMQNMNSLTLSYISSKFPLAFLKGMSPWFHFSCSTLEEKLLLNSPINVMFTYTTNMQMDKKHPLLVHPSSLRKIQLAVASLPSAKTLFTKSLCI
jgi:hypothetical protein